MFNQILTGEKPSNIFRKLMMQDAALTNRKLASYFYEEFSNIDGVAVQHIWNWRNSTKPTAHLTDGDLDKVLSDLLIKAGYISAPK